MTTGATGQLGLALPVQGELSGTWGDTVNNGLTQYINIAIAGTLTLTGDGAVTLANTTGDASASNVTSTLAGAGTVTAQFAIVRVTGTLTVAKVVTAPSYSKTYTVVNAATGGIVTFKASGQTGVSVAVGESAFVYFNGTDYVKVSGTVAVASFQTSLGGLTPSTATTGVVTLAGTLNTTSGGTGLTSFTAGDVPYYASGSVLSKLAIGTAGQFLTSTGTAPQWSTLSGVAVTTFSAGTTGFTPNTATSGAITLAGTLATTNGGTGLTSFTSGGVVYASSTSALATGSALTFDGTNFIVGGGGGLARFNVSNNGSGGFEISPDGTASGPALTAYNRGSSAFLQMTCNALNHVWSNSGTEGMRLTSTGLGIGTSSPATQLHVVGNITASAGNPSFYAKANNSGIASFFTQNAAGVDHWRIFSTMGSAGEQNNFVIRDVVGSSNIFNITSAGNVGIGTSSPATKLAVASANEAFRITGTNAYGTVTDGTVTTYLGAVTGGDAGGYTGTVSNHYYAIRTNNTERARIDSSGNLGIGTSSPGSYAADADNLVLASSGNTGMTIKSGATSTGNLYFANAENSTSNNGSILFNHNDLAFNFDIYGAGRSFRFKSAGTEVMRLDSAGNLGLGAQSPASGISSTQTVLEIANGNVAALSLNNTAAKKYTIYSSTTSSLSFYDVTAATERAKIPTTGGFQSVNSISVGNATPSTSGAGITFPATQSASADANTLDDYEEGTFTPSVTFGGGSTGITYDAVRRIGTYTKIGNKVFYFIHIELTSKGSSTGQALITGMPFTAAGTDAFVPASIFIAGMALITGQIMPRSSTGSTNIDIYQVVSSTYSAITDTNFTNTTGIQISGMYSA